MLIFLALVLLRVTVGYHFFKEGTSKLKYGFTASGFLSGAKGPLAPIFNNMVDDADGTQKLCIAYSDDDDGDRTVRVDPELTLAIWDDFTDEAVNYYGLGSIDLQNDITNRREALASQIKTARNENDTTVDTAALEDQRKKLEQSIQAIRKQPQRIQEIYSSHKELLDDWINTNRIELISHFSTKDRLQGFLRDGDKRDEVAVEVDSLRGQVDSIRSDRAKKLKSWSYEITTLWDSFETKVNALAVDDQANQASLVLHRPFDQKYSKLNVIDSIIPWFDTIVGVCLILGLFTRTASFAAGAFLLSVILTQPPWIPGTTPTYYQCIECVACLVIFATLAGRMAGLDYIIHEYLFGGQKKQTADAKSKQTQPAPTV
jgi:uncharacterized membrane protein YphA (DoxX/SURF4 family)